MVFARYPEPGRVKTRLAGAIGAGKAATLYRAFLADLALRLGEGPWGFFWAFEPVDSPFPAEIAGVLPSFPQIDGDLGARMAGAMRERFVTGDDRVVLIGSDVPHLPPARIHDTFDRLEAGAGLVLGPSEDGGYHLIGARGAVPPVFDAMTWGTADVLERTLDRARAAGLVTDLLPVTYDIDRVEDLRRLAADPVLADLPATRDVLQSLLPRLRFRRPQSPL